MALVLPDMGTALFIFTDTFSGGLCQRQYYSGNMQELTVKISDGQINGAGAALRPNREDIVCEQPASNETLGRGAPSLIIPPSSVHPPQHR